jgi:enoyl-CoA hydratase
VTVAVEARGVARVLRIERPARLNALDTATLRAMARVARALGRDREARGIVLTGTGRTFVAGGDLQAFARLRSASGGRRVAALGHDAIEALRATGLPLIAAVNGDAYGGGCELAAACDLRLVERHARFHWVQGRLGVTTGWGGTARLVELVGVACATRWLLTARTVDAVEAARARFADEVVEPGTSVEAGCALVEAIASVPAPTTRRQLALLRGVHGLSRDEGRLAEARVFGEAWASPEHHAAVARFLARTRGESAGPDQ